MSRVVVKARDWYANINGNKLSEENGMVCVYDCKNLVGVFDLGEISAIYISAKTEKEATN